MILDKEALFDSALALTTDQASTNIYDLGASQNRDVGIGDRPTLKARVQVTTAFLSTGSSTLTILFQGSTDNSTWDTYAQSPAIAKASLVAGAAYDLDWPKVATGKSLPRYLRLYYDVGVADFTAGALTSFLVLERQENIAYRAGINVAN